MSPRDSKAQMLVAHTETRPDGVLRFWCENLLEDSRCGIYATRPERCRAYPSPVMFERGGALLSGCGDRVVSNEAVEISLDRGVRPSSGGDPIGFRRITGTAVSHPCSKPVTSLSHKLPE